MNKLIGETSKKNLTWIREGECIRCTSHVLDNGGYPRIRMGGKPTRIARLILIRRMGDIPSDVVSRHTCDNTWCIRPDHIISGTQAENNTDRKERGRSKGQRGEDSHRAKLTSLQVLQIRESKERHSQIASRFGITTKYVSLLKHRGRWSHI